MRRMKPGRIAAKGESIYRRKIKSQIKSMKTVKKGDFVVIDVNSGDYEVGVNDAVTTRRLLNRHPDAITWAVRVGYRAAYGYGGGPQMLGLDD